MTAARRLVSHDWRRRPMCLRLVTDWLYSCCETGNGIYGRAGELYDSWRRFAYSRGEEPGSPAEFARAMESRGFICDRIPPIERNRVRWGLRLR